MGLFDGVVNVAAQMSPEELKKWAEDRDKAAREDPLNYSFPPHQGQLRAHQSEKHEVLLIASNRFGKSVTGMREALWRATGTHPYKKVRPHSTIWCGFLDYNFFRRTTLPIFKRWAPRKYLLDYDKTDKVATFRRVDGGVCEMHFISYESGRDKWQGASVDFVWPDEEFPKDIYEEATARLIDAGGDMFMTQTPISGLGWVYDDVFLPWQAGLRPDTDVIEGALAEYRPECVCGHMPEDHDRDGRCKVCKDSHKFEQLYELGVGEVLLPPTHPMGHRNKVLRFARSIKDPDMRMIRIFGKFKARAGGVYKQYKPEVHVIPPFKIPSHYEVWGGIDPGFHGFAVTLLASDPQGRVYVFYEYFSQHETTGARARELWSSVISLVPLGPDDYVPIYVDTEDPQVIMELNTWAQENGARLAFAALKQGLKARKAGIARVQEYLAPSRFRSTPIPVTRDRPVEGEPLIYFFDNLRSQWLSGDDAVATSRLLWEMSRYLWKRKGREGASSPDEPDKESAGGAHMLDALRYALMARVSPPEEPESDFYDPGEPNPGTDDIEREIREYLMKADQRVRERYE